MQRLVNNDPSLASIHLGWYNVDAAGAASFAEALSGNTHLRYLELSIQQLGEPGTASIQEGVECLLKVLGASRVRLHTLDLSNNELGEGVKHLCAELQGKHGKPGENNSDDSPAHLEVRLNMCANGFVAADAKPLAQLLAKRSGEASPISLELHNNGINEAASACFDSVLDNELVSVLARMRHCPLFIIARLTYCCY